MGVVFDEVVGIRTVGDLVAALDAFPDDMPVQVGGDERIRCYRVKPQRGELVKHRRGYIQITGDENEA